MSAVLSLLRPGILALAPYSPAQWDPALVRLHANENPWRSEFDSTRAGLNRYPEPQSSELASALAALYGVQASQVTVGRGSDEGIDLLVRAFCADGRSEVVICPPTFAMYRFAAAVQGAAVIEVPLRAAEGFSLDAEAVIAACTPDTRLLFLCSPNNPTGNALDRANIERILSTLAERAVVVVDEAYVEFSDQGSLVPLLARHANLVILRTLSKAFGLAGARCGAILASAELTEVLRRIVPPYAVTVQTIEAVLDALAPKRRAGSAARIERLRAERERLSAHLAALPLVDQVWPSQTNFLLLRSADAGRLLAAGIRGGLLVRDVRSQPGLGNCLRVSIGTPDQNDRLVASLEFA
jgi:histidinol-phosphate aminotransferase